MLLERHLPAFVRDAQRALELLDRPSRLAQDASIDALTGLANRRTLGRALGRLRSEDTVVMIDLDHFKAINDSHGHREGDKVLRLFGHTLAATVRAAEQVGRYGGEEFVVILPESGAERFLARLRIEWMRARPYPVTFSAGGFAGPSRGRPCMRPTAPCTGRSSRGATAGCAQPRRTTGDRAGSGPGPAPGSSSRPSPGSPAFTPPGECG